MEQKLIDTIDAVMTYVQGQQKNRPEVNKESMKAYLSKDGKFNFNSIDNALDILVEQELLNYVSSRKEFLKLTLNGREFTTWAAFTNEKLMEAEFKEAAHNLTLAQYDQVTQVLKDQPDVKEQSKESLKLARESRNIAKWSLRIAGAILLFEIGKYLYSFFSN